jgi:hypothetical protein
MYCYNSTNTFLQKTNVCGHEKCIEHLLSLGLTLNDRQRHNVLCACVRENSLSWLQKLNITVDDINNYDLLCNAFCLDKTDLIHYFASFSGLLRNDLLLRYGLEKNDVKLLQKIWNTRVSMEDLKVNAIRIVLAVISNNQEVSKFCWDLGFRDGLRMCDLGITLSDPEKYAGRIYNTVIDHNTSAVDFWVKQGFHIETLVRLAVICGHLDLVEKMPKSPDLYKYIPPQNLKDLTFINDFLRPLGCAQFSIKRKYEHDKIENLIIN